MKMDRRGFLRRFGLGVAAVAAGGLGVIAQAAKPAVMADLDFIDEYHRPFLWWKQAPFTQIIRKLEKTKPVEVEFKWWEESL